MNTDMKDIEVVLMRYRNGRRTFLNREKGYKMDSALKRAEKLFNAEVSSFITFYFSWDDFRINSSRAPYCYKISDKCVTSWIYVHKVF